MITPLAKCITSGCASVHPSASAEKALVSAALLVVGAVVLFAIAALLDEAPLRHRAHLLWKAKHCGRCQQEGRDLARSYRAHGLGQSQEASR